MTRHARRRDAHIGPRHTTQRDTNGRTRNLALPMQHEQALRPLHRPTDLPVVLYHAANSNHPSGPRRSHASQKDTHDPAARALRGASPQKRDTHTQRTHSRGTDVSRTTQTPNRATSAPRCRAANQPSTRETITLLRRRGASMPNTANRNRTPKPCGQAASTRNTGSDQRRHHVRQCGRTRTAATPATMDGWPRHAHAPRGKRSQDRRLPRG
jgi:hypothetical protein